MLFCFAVLILSTRQHLAISIGYIFLARAVVSRCSSTPTYYSFPGSKLVAVHDPLSTTADFCQTMLTSKLIRSVIKANSRHVHHELSSAIALTSEESSDNQEPRGFVVDADQTALALDTGANRVIVNDRSLLQNFRTSEGGIKGLGGTSVSSSGVGTYRFQLQSDDGVVETFDFPNAMHCPTSPYNLLPPQLLARVLKTSYNREVRISHDESDLTITWTDNSGRERVTTVPTSDNGLFLIHSAQGYLSFFRAAATYASSWSSFAGAALIEDSDNESTTSLAQPPVPANGQSEPPPAVTDASANLPNVIEHTDTDFEALRSSPVTTDMGESPTIDDGESLGRSPDLSPLHAKQARLMTIHETLGHWSFATLKLMARARLLPGDLSNVPAPVCPGCAYGKAHRKPWRSKGHRNVRKLKQANAPGAVVSIDQMVSPTPGFVPTHRGNPTTTRYVGATVFVDHYSDFTYVHLMTKLDAASTVEAKRSFERLAQQHGVRISHYHADNGLFDTKAFKEAVQVANQTLTFCGVNAHHQNGIAERRIRDVTEGARTALLHAAHRWPQAINSSLWPSAVKNYVNVRNAIPRNFVPGRKVGRKMEPAQYHDSPLSKFSRTTVEPNLKHYHPFGAPVYVLKEALQSQKSHNKWSDRSRVGIFLCHSPHHASDVPLVLNTQTGLVSPQFHVVYDDSFDTVRHDANFRSLWQAKAKLQCGSALDSSKDIQPTAPNPSRLSYAKSIGQTNTRASIPSLFRTPWTIDVPNTPILAETEGVSQITEDASLEVPSELTRTNEAAPARPTAEANGVADNELTAVDDTTELPREPMMTDPPRVTRSGRTSRPNLTRFDPRIYALSAFSATFSPSRKASGVQHEMLQVDLPTDEIHPFAALAQTVYGLAASRDPDTMTIEEALAQPDREQFILAMKKELDDHINRQHWCVIPRTEVPAGRHLIPMVWSMKRKRNPIGEITKWKARLCAGGHRQIHGLDYWSTYSPVVAWGTVRLIIILALVEGWHMRSIDFVLAFPQAPVSTDVYMKPPKVPKGFKIPDLSCPNDAFTKAYKLLRNLYGLKDAGRTWYLHLTAGLKKRGWRQSDIDTCLFTKGDVILVLYVDDAILASPNSAHIDEAISSLQEEFDLTDDGDLHDYLGTRFERKADGSIELTQPRMIARIMEYVGLDPESNRVKLHDSPAVSDKVLHKDTNGHERQQEWNYRGIVGCLSYLQAMVRPDITFAVQQCARFSNDPKRSHEEAIKRICRYVLSTKDRGLCFKPDKTKGLECFVDADWAGSWNHEHCDDPNTAHSRTGYVISYAGCPILWGSKLQRLIALSTTEAEYIALSSALREVISVMGLLNELRTLGFPVPFPTPTVTCKVFEDNRSCIEIATNHKTRPRTKHLSVRLHHFRSYVQSKVITIRHVSTTEQVADIFTKPLPTTQFKYLRDILMGWSPSSREGV